MAVTSGYFNSVDGDRKYDAEDVNKFFDGVVAEGVFSTIGGSLIVSATTGMIVSVASGKAWFLKSWITNTAPVFLSIANSDVTFKRYDAVVLDMNKGDGVRNNDILVVQGVPGSGFPAMINTDTHLQVALAYITVDAGVVEITAGKVINQVGVTSGCPFATGLIDQIDASELLQQWNYDLMLWILGIEDDLTAIETGEIFEELAEIRTLPKDGRNLLFNGGMLVNQVTGIEVTGYTTGADMYPAVADRWAFYTGGDSGAWTLTREALGNGKQSYKILCETASPTLDSPARLSFIQLNEGSTFGELKKGSIDGKEMTLSWDFKTNKLGRYVVEIYDHQNNRAVSAFIDVDISDVWQSYEILIPADTNPAGALTLDRNRSLYVCFWLVAGDDFQSGGSLQTVWGSAFDSRAVGQTNLAANVGNYVQFTDIQLELGPYKTDFERRTHDEELLRCRRYMEYYPKWWWGGLTIKGSTFESETAIVHSDSNQPYEVRKRVPPTISFSDAYIFQAGGFNNIPLSDFTENIVTDGGEFFNKELAPSFHMSSLPEWIPCWTHRCTFENFKVDAELY